MEFTSTTEMCNYCSKIFDSEFERSIREESEKAREAHVKVAKYFRDYLHKTPELMHTGVVVITSPPNHAYKVDFTGNIERDEFHFGLSVAQSIIMKKCLGGPDQHNHQHNHHVPKP